jgi:hypothetical protein
MGVFVSGGRATVEDCEIFAAGTNAVAVSGGGDVTVRRSQFHDCGSCGVFVND